MKRIALLLAVLTGSIMTLYAADPMQKTMLTGEFGWQVPGSKPRFAVPQDLVWPATHGEADVCLWEDDKFAAISMGIDDNFKPDHAWWLQMGEKYDLKFTWWAVTQGLEDVSNPSQLGTWDDFRALYAAGHEIGSHSANHDWEVQHTDAYWDEEMRLSNEQIRTAIPGSRVLTYAGPGGALPDADTTKKYYISARGTTGGINGAATTFYHNTRTMTTSGTPFKTDYILNPNASEWFATYRGWWVWFTHGTGDKTALENDMLIPMAAKRDSIWIGRYDRVAQYGQSRDTHTLTVTSVADDAICFTLTDSMCDSLFDYPLTVKVRLNNDWNTCVAAQNGAGIEATVVEHESNRYALVKAVPDRGEVILSKSGVSIVSTPVISPDGGSGVCSVQVSISCPDAGADIYFTIDGSDPDSTATLYTGPVTLTDDATVKAKAYSGTDMPSRAASASFTVTTKVEDVVISPAGGSHDDSVTVTLGCGTAGAVIRYTLDGSDPDGGSDIFAGGIVLTADATVKAKAFHGCLTASDIAQESFIVTATSGISSVKNPVLPTFTGTPMHFDCHGKRAQGVPQVPGVYFMFDGNSLQKIIIVD